jgi:flagellar basal-body rod protein FlgF
MNGLYLAAAGATTQLQTLDVISQNLANGSTPGFRRFELAIDSVQGTPSPYQYPTVQMAQPTLDMSQGPVEPTGDPLNVAVVGSGFMRVETPDGEAYTRNGTLSVDTDGTLMAAGQPLLQEGGKHIVVQPGRITVGSDGSVSVGGQVQGQIAMADPAGTTLVPSSGSLYRTTDDSTLPAADPSANKLRQGALETSTASLTMSLVSMMDTMRTYESSMRTVQAIDQNNDRAIQTFSLQV